MITALYDHMECFDRIENSKVEIYTRNKTGKTALMSQILERSNKEKIKLLLVNGADVHAQDIHGNTVLHFAAWIGCDIDIVKLLKEDGASAVQDKLGQLPCHIAQKRGYAFLAQELCSCRNQEHLKEETFHNECTHFYAEELNDTSYQNRLKYFRCDSISRLLNIPGVGKVVFEAEAGEIKSAINEIVTNICADIGQTDRLFSNTVIPSGSVNEETKVGLPDEFDFICRLDKFSSMCEIEKSDKTVVSLRVKQAFWTELECYQNESHQIGRQEAEDIWQRFIKNLESAVQKSNLCKHHNITLVSLKEVSGPNCKLTFRWSGCEYKDMEINVDIVPALQIPGWWPSKDVINYLPFDSTSVQQDGALLLFHVEIIEDENEANCVKLEDCSSERDFREYYSENVDEQYIEIRASASTAERAYMHQLPQLARDTYMLSKILCNERICPNVQVPDCHTPPLDGEETQLTDKILTNYILKNCLFYVFADETNHRGSASPHEHVCKIFGKVHEFCERSLWSFVFPEWNNIFSPQNETYDPCIEDRMRHRRFYSKLIVSLLREPDNWISDMKHISKIYKYL